MTAVFSPLLVLALSLLIVRVGAVALMMTGLSEEIAQFQSLSAFSNAGFTTSEAENIVSVSNRRHIIAMLIRLGSVGVVTAISSLILSFIGAGQATTERLLMLLLGALALIGLSRSRAFNRILTPLIQRVLARYTKLDLRDYAELLHLREDYRIVEIDIEPESWLASRRLGELNLDDEGVCVLGVMRSDGSYIGAPPWELNLEPGDCLTMYGREHRLKELSTRPSNDQIAHHEAKSAHRKDLARQERKLAGKRR